MSIKSIITTGILLVVCSFANISTAHAEPTDEDNYSYNYASLNNHCQVYDPYEPLNRKIFFINGVLDVFILKPITKIYDDITNDYIKQRVGGFLNNIYEPLSMVNYGLQGKPNEMLQTFWRFTINSTFGIFGIFDVASKFGLTSEFQTFGNTLGHYGVGSGPYIVLPLYGGIGTRDMIDPILLNSLLNPLKTSLIPGNLSSNFKMMLTIGDIIYEREIIMEFTDHISKTSSDPYITTRDAIMQQRESKMDYPSGFICPNVNNN